MRVSRFHRQIARVLQQVLSPLGYFEWSIILKKDLDEDIGIHIARISVTVREADRSDLSEISKATPYHLLRLLKERYAAGSKCLIAWDGADIAGFNWYVYGKTYDESFLIELEPGDIYCMDAMTHKPYRGQAIHTELLSRLLLDAKETGFRAAYTRASILNDSSWKTHARLGWRHHASTFLLKLRPVFGGSVIAWPKAYPLRNDMHHRAG